MPADRAQRIGIAVSGTAHLAAILWLVLGGIFFSHDLPPATVTTEVSLISAADFAAMQARAPTAPVEAPPQPSAPEPPAAETPSLPEAETAPVPSLPAEPEAEAAPDAAPDVSDLAPPETEVTDTPPTPLAPPVEEPAATIMTEVNPRPKPRPAPRVAPTPSEAPEPEAEPAPEAVAETVPDPSAEPLPEPVEEAAAPPEAGEVLETEENRDPEEVASAAPISSARPRARPEKPAAPAAPAAPETETETASTAPETEGASDTAVADALAEALAGEAAEDPAPGTGTAASGPPLTSGEKDALVVAVKQCWNVGSLSTDALRTVVTVGVTMAQDGKPDGGSIRMLGFEGGDETAARQAFEAGRRAILRCARDGYPLPAEKYAQWREIEIVFNPEKMRMK